MVLAGSVLSMITVSVQAALLLSDVVAPWSLFLPGFFLTFSQGIALPYAQVGAMGTIPRLAGTAAGAGVFMQNMGAALFTQLYGLVANGTPAPMMAVVALSGILVPAAGVLPSLYKGTAGRWKMRV
jgi:DHA1 family bicyclomycin/chloramphenicol resistance-like MFS transporter